jgi:Flp pilus assembly protein TadD/predicted Ser/Thr protein kinase
MAEERRARLWALFDQAADLPPPEQRALLDAECPDDPDLRAELERLLADDARVGPTQGSFLKSPLVLSLPTPTTLPAGGSGAEVRPQIGRYRVVRLLGEGGMGTVYEAEQESPRRTVALKVIRPGLVSPSLLKRFALEAQILGLLRHPGIAQVYEAGVAEGGQPYFAMELIAGVPLDRHAAERSLDARGRLELAARVADAVQHAHEHGVVHRDLKPANILVDDTGQPKVLDFGVARALDDDLRGSTAPTQTGQLVGTPCYMSPEQVAADPNLDRRSDVYTLGVILFELLAGRLPYPVEHQPLGEAMWLIATREPARLGALDRRLRGDVEIIVGKALEKDPARRYPSAAELSEDIRRHLRHEPIRARPPSVLYQLGKFARRHKALVATTAAFLGLLLAGGAVTAWQAVRLARAERDQAVAQAERSRKVHAALERSALLRDQARATRDAGKWAEAREEARQAEALTDDGPVESDLAERVKVLRDELDEEQADSRLVARLEQIRLLQAEINLKTKRFALERSLPGYRQAFADYGLRPASTAPAEAAALLRRRPAVRDAVVGSLDDWLVLARLEKAAEVGWLERVLDAADADDWRHRLRAAIKREDRKALEDLAREVKVATQPPQAFIHLENALRVYGSPEAAVGLLRRAQVAHSGDFWINEGLGIALCHSSPPQLDEAIRFLTAGAALRPESALASSNLGAALQKKGRLDEAGDAFRKAIELKPDYPQAHFHLGVVLRDKEDLSGAERSFRRATELDPKDPDAHLELGILLYQRGELPRAERSFRRVIELDPKNVTGQFNLGIVLIEKRDLPGAAACYRRVLALDRGNAGAHCQLGYILIHLGELRAALAALRTGHDLGSRRKDWGYPSAKWVHDCEQFIALDARLPAILQGADRPRSLRERVELAELCRYKRLYSTSVRFFAEAFAAEAGVADDLRDHRRYHAACAAALAGCGAGEYAAAVPDKARASLRKQALAWLHADLAGRARLAEGGSPEDRFEVWKRLGIWQADPSVAGVRDAGALAALPAAERAGWVKLWADVAATRARARDRN